MKRLQFTEMTREVYAVMTALRGPDCKVLADALKWAITARIRFYVVPGAFNPESLAFMVRSDARSDSYDSYVDAQWGRDHHNWDKAIEVGVPYHSLLHWADHADSALEAIYELCTTETRDNKLSHRDEIHIMISLLNTARTALSPHSDPDMVAEAQQAGHRQLTMLQNITDDLAQAQEATNE